MTFRLGRYEITGRIASGGMATVYRARLDRTGGFAREFALKVIHPHLADESGFLERFLEEARVASRVRHPNVVATIDVGEDAGYQFIVLELIDGLTLRQLLLHRERACEPEQAARIIADAARGLHAVHAITDAEGRALHVVHRDLSPHNLMLDREGRTVLIDLGLAKAADQPGLTRTGVLCGKLPYMSPEQSRLEDLDARSDVFALGSVLFELCTNELPFGDEQSASTLERLRACDTEPLRERLEHHEVPEWLSACILRCLRLDIEQRFQSALALAETLEQGISETVLNPGDVRRQLAALVGMTLRKLPPLRPAEPLVPRIVPRAATGATARAARWLAVGAALALLAFITVRMFEPDAVKTPPSTTRPLAPAQAATPKPVAPPVPTDPPTTEPKPSSTKTRKALPPSPPPQHELSPEANTANLRPPPRTLKPNPYN